MKERPPSALESRRVRIQPFTVMRPPGGVLSASAMRSQGIGVSRGERMVGFSTISRNAGGFSRNNRTARTAGPFPILTPLMPNEKNRLLRVLVPLVLALVAIGIAAAVLKGGKGKPQAGAPAGQPAVATAPAAAAPASQPTSPPAAAPSV